MEDKYIEKNDFLVRLRPHITEQGEWEGDMDVAIVTQPGNDVDDETYFQMMHLTKMVASSIPLMEDDYELREMVSDYVISTLDNDIDTVLEEDNDNTVQVISEEDNVVTINFNTKTKGSA